MTFLDKINKAATQFYKIYKKRPTNLILGKYELTLVDMLMYNSIERLETSTPERKMELLGFNLIKSELNSIIEVE